MYHLKHHLSHFVVALSLLFLATTGTAQDDADGEPALGNWGVETQHLSPTVAPGDDFFTYVNEGWLKQAQLPQGMPSMNSFTEVFLRTEAQVQAIVDDLLAGKGTQDVSGKQITGLYRSYMDEPGIEALGLKPIRAELDAVLATDSAAEIARWMARPLHESVVGLGVNLDETDPDHYTLYVGQSGLGLPGREYYLSDQPPFPQIRQSYRNYIEQILTLAQIGEPREQADTILAFETKLAERHWTPDQQRERLKNYNPMTREELITYAPGFEWQAFFEESGVGAQKNLIVTTNTAIRDTAALVAQTPIPAMRSYLAFHFINNQAKFLSSAYRDANFDFFSRTLHGIEQQRPRELDALQYVSNNLGEVLGRLYVDRYFPAKNKASMTRYIDYIRKSFRQRIEQSQWMDKKTKAEAFAKLDAFVAKIGYPDRWRDFSTVVIKDNDLVGNNLRIQQWYYQDAIAKLGQPRRHWEWGMSPQVVNAYYSAQRNEIVFPAAILQPPFFDPAADPAVNFAAIGAVIGHEMGHGFDDQGSRSDGEGVLRDWWTQDSRAHFERATRTLVEQYNSYEPVAGTPINGQLTLGENIGDLGGLTIAYNAYQNYLRETSNGEAPVIDGLTGDQRFFLAWAQLWRIIQTEDYLRSKLLTDPHSPGQYRVNGVVRNMEAWYDAFGVTPEHQLYLTPEERANIW